MFALLAWALVGVEGPLGAQESVTLFQDRELTIVGESALEVEAKVLRQVFPKARDDVEEALGWKLVSKPTVILVASRVVFEQASGSPYVSAFAIPARHSVVIRVSSSTSNPYILSEILRHELCHLLLHGHIRGELLPRWLDEGVCQWVSGSLGELLASEGGVLSGIDVALHAIPLERLTFHFPGERGPLLLAYKESLSFVEYLTGRYGTQTLLHILKNLKEGVAVDLAISKTLSKSLEDLQAEWLEDLRGRGGWLIWASQNLYEILFFLGAILTVLASVRLMVRKKRYPEDDGESNDPT